MLRGQLLKSVLQSGLTHSGTHIQRVQNAAARVVLCCRRQDDAVPLLHSLHWLPVAKRIIFKVCVIVFECRYGFSPVYLSELVPEIHINTAYNLRSNTVTKKKYFYY